MNFKQKLGYMFIGCLFTIAGYIIASLGGDTTHAQENDRVIDKIVCRELEVVNKAGKRMILMGPFIEGGAVLVFNKEGKQVVNIGTDFGNGVMELYNTVGVRVVRTGADILNGNGSVEVKNVLGKPGIDILADEKGGVIAVFHAASTKVACGMAGKAAGGVIEVYNTVGYVGSPSGLVGSLYANEDGGALLIRDTTGKEVVRTGVTENGNGYIRTYKGGWRTH